MLYHRFFVLLHPNELQAESGSGQIILNILCRGAVFVIQGDFYYKSSKRIRRIPVKNENPGIYRSTLKYDKYDKKQPVDKIDRTA